MSADTPPLIPNHGADLPDPAAAQKIAEKKKKKFRSAWISFVSRILAQVVGAAATLVLGLMVLQKYQSGGSFEPAAPAERVSESVARTSAAPLRERAAGEGHAMLVLPFANYSGEAQHAATADAVTEAVIAALIDVESLRVISRTSSMHYRDVSRPLAEIAREVEVDWVIEGSLTVADGQVRVIVQLIDGRRDEHVWAQAYDRPLSNVLALQSALAPRIARDVEQALAPHARSVEGGADGRAGAGTSGSPVARRPARAQ